MSFPPIPFANPRVAYMQRRREILDAVAHVFDVGQYILGPEVEALKKPLPLGSAVGMPLVAPMVQTLLSWLCAPWAWRLAR